MKETKQCNRVLDISDGSWTVDRMVILSFAGEHMNNNSTWRLIWCLIAHRKRKLVLRITDPMVDIEQCARCHCQFLRNRVLTSELINDRLDESLGIGFPKREPCGGVVVEKIRKILGIIKPDHH